MESHEIIAQKKDLLSTPDALAPCQALLERDPIRYMDLAEPIRRGEGTVLTATADGALVALCKYDQNGEHTAFSLVAKDRSSAERLLSQLPSDTQLIFLHEDFSAALAAQMFPELPMSPAFRTAAYLAEKPIPEPETDFLVKNLTMEHFPIFLANYTYEGEDYFAWLVEHKEIFGAFEGDELMGFIGHHKEGSIGLLEILPQYRRRGLARLLETYITNHDFAMGKIPYCQVFEDNAPSLSLQSSLGMTFSNGRAWFFSK